MSSYPPQKVKRLYKKNNPVVVKEKFKKVKEKRKVKAKKIKKDAKEKLVEDHRVVIEDAEDVKKELHLEKDPIIPIPEKVVVKGEEIPVVIHKIDDKKEDIKKKKMKIINQMMDLIKEIRFEYSMMLQNIFYVLSVYLDIDINDCQIQHFDNIFKNMTCDQKSRIYSKDHSIVLMLEDCQKSAVDILKEFIGPYTYIFINKMPKFNDAMQKVDSLIDKFKEKVVSDTIQTYNKEKVDQLFQLFIDYLTILSSD
jgi:hypothetical protein